MNLTRYDYPVTANFEQLLGALLPAASRLNGAGSCPAVNLSEDAERYYVRVELPGVKKEDIKVEFDHSVLTVNATRVATTSAGEKTLEFERSINVPEGVDPAKIQATYENGLLTLTLAKPETVKPRRIDLN